MTRAAPRHPLHHAFDGEEGLDRPFPPTRFSKEAAMAMLRGHAVNLMRVLGSIVAPDPLFVKATQP